jgi:hypothetical protein
MNKQEEYNKILDVISQFERIATKEEREEVVKALRDYLKRSIEP